MYNMHVRCFQLHFDLNLYVQIHVFRMKLPCFSFIFNLKAMSAIANAQTKIYIKTTNKSINRY